MPGRHDCEDIQVSNRTIHLDDALYNYFQRVGVREPDILSRLRAETMAMPHGGMQICPEQGQLMGFLVRLMGARKALELGTFTGYSALSVVLAMPAEGRLVACDRSTEWTDIARRYWREAGVDDRIDLRIGKALDTLDALIAGDETGTFDFVFIDADKKNYNGYYERALVLLRANGLIAIDNTLWSGRLIDPNDHEPATEALRALNEKINADNRVDMSMLPIGDGLTLARKCG
jgi:predicted O-methyltransferase YrrM